MKTLSFLRNRLVAKLDDRLDPYFYDEFEKHPIVIYDVGAAGGVYSPYLNGPHTWAPVVAFEPHPHSYESLKSEGTNKNASIYQLALTDTDGLVTFHAAVGNARTKSSLVPIENLGLETELQEVQGARLDSLPQLINVSQANFLKLDVEGSEWKILQGGEAMLRQDILGIRIEVAFWAEGNNGAMFREIDAFLSQQGFVLFDLQTNRSDLRFIGGRKDKIRSGDALYLRHFEHLCETSENKALLRIKLLKLISLSITWRYLNYGLELAQYGLDNRLITPAEYRLIVRPWLATVDLSDLVPNFPGRMLFARIFEVLSYAFHPNFKKGVPYSFNGLGNHWVVRRIGRQPKNIQIYCPVLKHGSKHRSKIIHINRDM